MSSLKVIILGICFNLNVLVGIAQSQEVFPQIKIYVSPTLFSKLQKSKGDKLDIENPILLINGDTASVKEVHTRGNNTLNYKRKSFSVELSKSIAVNTGDGIVQLKKFNLLNLAMDKHLWHNRWSNLNMQTIGIFPLYNTYCSIWINDQHQGFYLLVEKPQHTVSNLKSPYMLRRGPKHTISDEYFDKNDKALAREYRKQFESIYPYLISLEGKSLYDQINKMVNMESYDRYIAFNHLVMNGDYADEVFLYIEPNQKWFQVIPWDFDDILRPFPHEGRVARNEQFPDKKIFSLEEDFDRAIAGNSYLYSDYEKVLKNTLTILDSTKLSQTTWKVINELEMLNQDEKGVAATLFLDKEPFNMSAAKKDILTSLDLILKRRNWILGELK